MPLWFFIAVLFALCVTGAIIAQLRAERGREFALAAAGLFGMYLVVWLMTADHALAQAITGAAALVLIACASMVGSGPARQDYDGH